MPEDELTALLTLNRIDGLGCIGAKYLYEQHTRNRYAYH